MRAAAAQIAPVFLDPAATLEKMLDTVDRAASSGVRLLAFGETVLPGYPAWLSPSGGARFEDPAQKAAYSAYLEVAVPIDGPEVAALVERSRRHGMFIYAGIAERGTTAGRGTVYCTLLALHPERGLVGSHRKLMPTYEERLVWGTGDGAGLRCHDAGGLRVGGLNCWENWMPPARMALYGDGEELHVSAWPGGLRLTRDISRFTAREGRVYVVAASGLLRRGDVPDSFPLKEATFAGGDVLYDGGSLIVDPRGEILAGPLVGEEGLVAADIDPGIIREERQNFDPAGHYSRPDVFRFAVSRRRLRAVVFEDDAGNGGRSGS